MRVKPANQNAIIRDPHTRRALPAEGGNVPGNSFWMRRLIAGEIIRLDGDEPTGVEPVTPLTTRARR